MSECLFCKIVSRQIPSKMERETELLFAFHDINPQAPVHILLIPKKHIEKLSDLKIEDAELISEIAFLAQEIARAKKLEGYRLVLNNGLEAGQTVFHLHFHLLGGRKMNWPPG